MIEFCNYMCLYKGGSVLLCIGTGKDVDLEVLVDDFLTFYMAGEQNYELCMSVWMSAL